MATSLTVRQQAALDKIQSQGNTAGVDKGMIAALIKKGVLDAQAATKPARETVAKTVKPKPVSKIQELDLYLAEFAVITGTDLDLGVEADRNTLKSKIQSELSDPELDSGRERFLLNTRSQLAA